MNKEDIIRLSKNENDEREVALKYFAVRCGGTVGNLYAAILLLVCVFEHYIIESGKNYDFPMIMFTILSICSINLAIRSIIEWYSLKNKKSIPDAISFSIFFIVSIVQIISFFIA